LQDVINDDEIKLDWFFKASLIHDLVHVSSLFAFHYILYCNLKAHAVTLLLLLFHFISIYSEYFAIVLVNTYCSSDTFCDARNSYRISVRLSLYSSVHHKLVLVRYGDM